MISRMKLEGAVSVGVVSPVAAWLGSGFMVSFIREACAARYRSL
jgi:hypothetical protein